MLLGFLTKVSAFWKPSCPALGGAGENPRFSLVQAVGLIAMAELIDLPRAG